MYYHAMRHWYFRNFVYMVGVFMHGVIWKFRIFGSFDPIHTATFGLLGVHPLFHDTREIHPLHEIHEQPERHESQGTKGITA